MSTRTADDFAPIRARLQELRGGLRALVHEDMGAATERYPRHVMAAAIRLLHELAARDRY
jgi:hypothetical protein